MALKDASQNAQPYTTTCVFHNVLVIGVIEVRRRSRVSGCVKTVAAMALVEVVYAVFGV
jgi:hypothetical protein